MDGEDLVDDIDLDENEAIWQQVSIKFQNFTIMLNKVDSDLEFGYKEKVKVLK